MSRRRKSLTDQQRAKLRRYEKALSAGKTATAAARMVGVEPRVIAGWADKAAPVAMTTAQRKCLGGCDQLFESSWPGERICPSCKGRFAALSKQWVA